MGDTYGEEVSAVAEYRSRLLVDDPQGREVNKTAWGEWLSAEWDWDWWVTLTYDSRKHVQGSATHTAVGWGRSDRDWEQWLSDTVNAAALEGDALDPPYWFRGREPNPYRYGTHFHALVGNVKEVSRRDAWARWFHPHGHARIEPYDPSRGAGFYVAKYVAKELGDLTFSPNAGLYRKDARTDARERERTDAEAAARTLYPWDVQGNPTGAQFRPGRRHKSQRQAENRP